MAGKKDVPPELFSLQLVKTKELSDDPADTSNDPTDDSLPDGKSDRQEFFLPVNGFVWLYPEEVYVVDHPAFQRLSRINQLGQSYFVFRGATHKRFEHVLGAVQIVQRMISAVRMNAPKLLKKNPLYYTPPLSDYEERFVRLGALLHDIGHLAAGHTLEDELGLVSKHDEDRRLDIIFNNALNLDWLKDSSETERTLAALIDEKYLPWLKQAGLDVTQITPSKIVLLLIRKNPKEGDKENDKDQLKSEIKYLQSTNKIRLDACRDMIGNTICADLLDYIYRDWYHVGKPRPFDDRLLQYMEIRSKDPRTLANNRTPLVSDQFIISLGKRPKIRSDAVSHILELLEWRYSLAETVLFHRTKLSAAAMLDRALYELWGDNTSEDNLIDICLPLSDEELLTRCRSIADNNVKDLRAGATNLLARYQTASRLLSALQSRGLYKQVSTLLYTDLHVEQIDAIKSQFSPLRAAGSSAEEIAARDSAKARNMLLRKLEIDFKLNYGSLVMYCPSKMNRKIAQVKIAVGNEVAKLSDYESRDKHDRELTGGHLEAQLKRFDRLWRVHFFLDPKEEKRIGEARTSLLKLGIEYLALGHVSPNLTPEAAARLVASGLLSLEDTPCPSPWKKRTLVPVGVAASNNPLTAEVYPFGAPSIESLLSSQP